MTPSSDDDLLPSSSPRHLHRLFSHLDDYHISSTSDFYSRLYLIGLGRGDEATVEVVDGDGSAVLFFLSGGRVYKLLFPIVVPDVVTLVFFDEGIAWGLRIIRVNALGRGRF